MKVRSNFSYKFLQLTVIILISISLVIAPSHPVVDEEIVNFAGTGTITAGDGFLHTIEEGSEEIHEWWVSITATETELAELQATHLEEDLAEAKVALDDGNTDAATSALESATAEHEDLQSTIETIGAETETTTLADVQTEDSVVHDLVTIEAHVETIDNQIAALETQLTEQVNAGTLTDTTVTNSFNNLEGSHIETQLIINEQEAAAVDSIVENSNGEVSPLEAELEINKVEDTGLTHDDITHDNFIALETAIVGIGNELEELEETGEDTTAAEQLLANAELHLAQAETALAEGNTGEAHGLLTSAEHLVANCDRFLDDPDETRDELDDLAETQTTEKIAEEIQRDSHSDYGDNEEYWTSLKEKYADNPETLAKIEAEQARAEEVNVLFSSTDLSAKIQDLMAQRKSDEEAHKLVTNAFANLYGKEYVPPGTYFVEVETEVKTEGEKVTTEVFSPSELITDENKNVIGAYVDGKPVYDIKAGGGYVLGGHEYTDPTTDITYEFDIDANGDYYYTYENVLGQKYTVELPDNYDSQTQAVFDKGNEIQKVNYESSTGENVVFEYSVLGTEIKTTEGETLTKDSYDPGKHPVAGGEEIKIDAIGVTCENKDNEATVLTYSPEFKNYYDKTSGVVFNSEISHHDESTIYTDGKYVYTHAGDNYGYDPNTDKWTLPDGKTIAVQTAPAPIGTDQKEYTTKHGETWKLEDGTWKAYNSEDKVVEQYTPSIDNYYHHEAGEIHTDPETGKTWTATTTTDEKGNTQTVWKSSDGESWNPQTGDHKDSSGTVVTTSSEDHYGYYKDHETGKTQTYTHTGGYYAETPGGSYSYVNPTSGSSTYTQSGTTWTYDSSTEAWTSSTGETHTESAGHADYAGHVGSYDSGSYSDSYSGTTTYSSGDYSSYSGTYTAPSDGTYSGGTYSSGSSDGSYSGGSYSSPPSGGGGSAPSGGDGGHTGGHVIADIDDETIAVIIKGSSRYRLF